METRIAWAMCPRSFTSFCSMCRVLDLIGSFLRVGRWIAFLRWFLDRFLLIFGVAECFPFLCFLPSFRIFFFSCQFGAVPLKVVVLLAVSALEWQVLII